MAEALADVEVIPVAAAANLAAGSADAEGFPVADRLVEDSEAVEDRQGVVSADAVAIPVDAEGSTRPK